MKAIIIALLCIVALQQTVLLSSAPWNTIITWPTGLTIAADNHHNTNNPNYISYSAQWLWKSGLSSWPDGDVTIFQAQFNSDCQNLGSLIITADNIFSASLNGGAAMTGNNWQQVYKFDLTNIQCGTNTLNITVTNQHGNSPAAVIFAVVQDQSGCYACKSPLSFYNRDTCKCQCLGGCDCKTVNPLYTWYDYPTCGCKCADLRDCVQKKYWDDRSCSCKCKACPRGYMQDRITCQCMLQCVQTYDCPIGQFWHTDTCSCDCPSVFSCSPPTSWDEKTCKCVYRPIWSWGR